MEKKLIKFAQIKAKNKRIDILAYQVDDGSFALVITTKNLFGNWKDRDIHKTNVCYGMQSFLIIRDIMNFMIEDPEFLKIFHREMSQLEKGIRPNCVTNIKITQ